MPTNPSRTDPPAARPGILRRIRAAALDHLALPDVEGRDMDSYADAGSPRALSPSRARTGRREGDR